MLKYGIIFAVFVVRCIAMIRLEESLFLSQILYTTHCFIRVICLGCKWSFANEVHYKYCKYFDKRRPKCSVIQVVQHYVISQLANQQ